MVAALRCRSTMTSCELRIARRRVFEMIRDGRLPSVRIGRSRRIRRSDLAVYVAKLAVVPHQE